MFNITATKEDTHFSANFLYSLIVNLMKYGALTC